MERETWQEDKCGERNVTGGQTWRENSGRRTNVESELLQEDKRGERTVSGGQIWRENCGRRTNV